jgi:hypothetical protein
VKIVFFSGEEEGICGSGAYVRQHPASDMWRAVNMDQTAFDGNANRLMDVYNWNALNSPASVALGDAFVQANSDYGTIIDPAKIVRDTSKMCQTDHCPFWNVGVGRNRGHRGPAQQRHLPLLRPVPDLDLPRHRHPDLQRAADVHAGLLLALGEGAVALVAALADPLYACPAAAPTPTAIPENKGVRLAWPAAAGVTHYVVERAVGAAPAPSPPVASVTGTQLRGRVPDQRRRLWLPSAYLSHPDRCVHPRHAAGRRQRGPPAGERPGGERRR